MSLYTDLRAEQKTFIYHGYQFGADFIEYEFSIDDEYYFYPRWEFDSSLTAGEYDRALAERIAFSLGMAELVSYWKCMCCPQVEIRCGGLDEWEIGWWKKLYFNGLGEFFYRNDITPNFDDFMEITAPLPEKLPPQENKLHGVLVPVGGGKDSVVSLELLKKAGEDIHPYIINPRGATLGCAEAAGIDSGKIIGVKRSIDRTLLTLNSEGYLNGHTPFSAVVAFSTELFACLKNLKYIALSNESSANEAYVEGTTINHQYSKSTEFERDFREYCAHSFGSGAPEYFSLLRPWSEWQIAREFVKYPQYFGVFQSCNLGSKTNTWCGHCAKCLYVYILLAAFLDDDVLTKIFGCNMLEKDELFPMLDGLMLDGTDKPFECVGTKEEVRLSLKMACDRRGEKLPPLLVRFCEHFPNYTAEDLSDYFDRNNFVPRQFLPLIGGKA